MSKNLLKNLVVLVILNLFIIFGLKHVQPLVLVLVSAHDWISQLILPFFPGSEVGLDTRHLLSLLIMPLFLAAIPALIYWLAKRRFFPYFMHVVWVFWLVQTTAIVVLSPVVV